MAHENNTSEGEDVIMGVVEGVGEGGAVQEPAGGEDGSTEGGGVGAQDGG